MDRIETVMVERTWEEMNYLTIDESMTLVNKMAKEHPAVVAYLMTAGDNLLSEDERDLLIYLGMVVWQIVKKLSGDIPQITTDHLERAETQNIQMLEYLEGESEEDFMSTIQVLIESYNQPEILRYVVEAIIEDDEDSFAIGDEAKGVMLLCIKTVIDAFDRQEMAQQEVA